MGDFLDKARELAEQHDDKVDEALQRGGEFADERTGGKYDEQIDKGVDWAQEHTGEGATPG
jgi:MT0933-like antitoxin protein